MIEQLWGVSKKRRSLFIDKSGPEIFKCLQDMANFRDNKRLKNEKSIPMSYDFLKSLILEKIKQKKEQIFNTIRN